MRNPGFLVALPSALRLTIKRTHGVADIRYVWHRDQMLHAWFFNVIRWLRQLWCAHRGHPYRTITIPIVGQRPDDEETDRVFCQNCGAEWPAEKWEMT